MRSPDYTRRVVVTGLGVISPVGNDKDTAWSNLIDGVSGLKEITKFDMSPYDHKAAGEVVGLHADRLDGTQGRAPERGRHVVRRGGREAGHRRRGPGDHGREPEDIGVVFGTGAGGQR